MPFVLLLFAHLLSEFVFQPRRWVEEKRKLHARSGALYGHILIVGVTAWFFFFDTAVWLPILILMGSHFFIDLWASYRPNNLKYFLIDQFLHLFVIFNLFIFFFDGDLYMLDVGDWFTDKNILKICAYIFVIYPAGYIVGLATKKWQEEIEPEEGVERDSLKNAGKWIGIIERVLILTLVYLGQFGAIGFLIAAKSILRITDKSEQFPRKQTEYVLIGTLLSFTLAIVAGLLSA
jgi:hypothetical protein